MSVPTLVLLAAGAVAQGGAVAAAPSGFAGDLAELSRQLRATHPEFDRRIPAARWQAALDEVAGRLEGMSEARFVLEAQRLVALLRDGHSRVEFERSAAWQETLPLRLRRFDDGLFVIAAAPDHAALLGARVTRIGAREIEPLALAARELVSGDDAAMRDAFAPQMLVAREALELLGAGPAGEPFEVAFVDREGKAGTAMLAASGPGGAPFEAAAGWSVARPAAGAPSLRPRPRGQPYAFECLDDEWAVYCRFDAVVDAQGEPFADFVARMFAFVEENEIERLVLDLRHNGGGNNYLVQPLLHAILRCERIDQAGRLFVLTGPQTYSAAVNCASDLERETRALFVGGPTGAGPNHCGDATSFVLPASRATVRCSTLAWQKSDPRDARSAILPDLPVEERFEEWLAGRDPALEAALAFDPDCELARETAQTPPNRRWTRASQGRGR